ncbi:MAG: pyruvate, phosphate dikinase [Candidatus Bathyarchaeia archaeon]
MELGKSIVFFDEGLTDRKLLGGKGAGLAEMMKLGIPVPPGFTITTEVCRLFYEGGERLPDGLMEEVRRAMGKLEELTGKGFGDHENPLLVSVRSGAAISMPGMMDTVLNLGLNDRVVEGLARATGDERFAYDAYRRFIQLFGKIVLGIDESLFSRALEELKRERGAEYDTDLDAGALRELVRRYKAIILKELGRPFPEDPYEQLEGAIAAVFRSWNSKRCVDYRRQFRITPDIADGTAVNIVAMVFGNMGPDSSTGVVFTRDPATGERGLYGDYLPNAQGEDVVAGIRTPRPIQELEAEAPRLYKELVEISERLERHFRYPQDIEFTIERGKLWILQTRNAKMNAAAKVRSSVDMVKEGIITKEEAIMRVEPEELEQLLHKRVDPKFNGEALAIGIPASPGAASGIAVFDADEAERRHRAGERVILVREETKPEDIHGFFASEGILTSRGGKTSHAAVVARGMGKPCVVGCGGIIIDPVERLFRAGEVVVKEGDLITIDGGSGKVYLGLVPLVEPELAGGLQELLAWADEFRRLGVRANADTPEAARLARRFGAEGIGLCRTERMFNAPDRLPVVIEMIMAEDEAQRRAALEKLEPMQKGDFKEILKAMEGLPVTIRLLDPPLHEFLPNVEELTRALEKAKGNPAEEERLRKILARAKALAEVNPMLGHRGVRVGITHPEIYEMQVRAILEATAELMKSGVEVKPQIMIPQVAMAEELEVVKGIVERVRAEVERKYGMRLDFKFGTMIEVVRACLVAGEIAKHAEFFSFGTNDLTQGAFSFSREDAENKFLPKYMEKGILPFNPFQTIERAVARLMAICVQEGRRTRPDLEIGICGEQGGDPASIGICHELGLTYVSASPYRIPIARLAAARAAIREGGRGAPRVAG